jgi:hypothetical protein
MYSWSSLLDAAGACNLARVKLLFHKNPSIVNETDERGSSPLHFAVASDSPRALETAVWLIREGGLSIGATDNTGWTPLLHAAFSGRPTTVRWLLEYGGADIAMVSDEGFTVWDFLGGHLIEYFADEGDANFDAAAVTALLRVMVLRGGPPSIFRRMLSPEHTRVVQEGARLRAELQACLARRQALLDEHCPLIAPLRDLVHGYEVPTTTEELWATGLGAERQPQAEGVARQRGARPPPSLRSPRQIQTNPITK